MTDAPDRLENTIQMLAQKFNYFDVNERVVITPLSKMLFTTRSLAKLFDDTAGEIKKLEQLYKDPITFVLKNYDTGFSEKKKVKISIGKTLGQIEWIFYRDSHKFTSLKKVYTIDALKPQMSKSITFEDITAVRGYVEMEINGRYIKIIKDHAVNVAPLNLPIVNSQELDNAIRESETGV